MSAAALSSENPADLMYQAESILDFLSEALSALAAKPQIALSGGSLEGLAFICLHLRVLCEEAAGG